MDGIRNCTEDVAEQLLDIVFEEYPEACQCEKCRRDIVALALNKLPPHYVSTDKGTVIVKTALWQSQLKIDVLAALTNAVEIVSKDVRHE